MGERSGLGLVEITILEALDTLGARSDRPALKCAKVVAEVDDRIGLAPGYAYDVLCDLARPWTAAIRLVDFHGNYGSQDYPAAGPRYVESRLSVTGELAIDSEHGGLAPVPIGLINGNTYREGTRPPFSPQRMIQALRQVINEPGIPDRELIDIIGPPDFLTGCAVKGDLQSFFAGHPTQLRLEARVTVIDGGQVAIENIPPNAGAALVSQSISERVQNRRWGDDFPELNQASRLPVSKLDNLSSGTHDRLVCVPESGVPPEDLRDRLLDVYGISTTVAVALPGPLGALVRGWVDRHRDEDITTSLDALTAAIDRQLRR